MPGLGIVSSHAQALLRSTGVATSQSTTGTEEAKDFKVVVTLDSPTDELRPGLSTTAKITTGSEHNVLTIPIQALTIRDKKDLEAQDNKTKKAQPADTPAPLSIAELLMNCEPEIVTVTDG